MVSNEEGRDDSQPSSTEPVHASMIKPFGEKHLNALVR